MWLKFLIPSLYQPVNNLPTAHVTSNKSVINNSAKSASTTQTEKSDIKPLGVKIDCKTVILEEKFQCKSSELFDCFSKVELMSAFTRSDVKLDFKKGGEWVLKSWLTYSLNSYKLHLSFQIHSFRRKHSWEIFGNYSQRKDSPNMEIQAVAVGSFLECWNWISG